MANYSNHPRPTEQAQRAVKAMLAAGFKRSEFSVRTRRVPEAGRLASGRRSWHYGDACIVPYVSSDTIWNRRGDILAAGLTLVNMSAGSERPPYWFIYTTPYSGSPAIISGERQVSEFLSHADR